MSASCNSGLTRGYTVALVSAAILSTTAILIRHLTQTYHMPPLVLAFWRDGFVAFTLLPILRLLHPCLLRVTRQQLLYLIIYGLMLAIFNTLWTFSVALIGAAISTVLVYSSAGFTALLGWCLLKERLNWGKLLAIVLSLWGCVLVSGALDSTVWHASLVDTLLGVLTGVLSGLWYAIYSLMGRSASRRGLNPWTTLFYTFGFATIFLLLFHLLSRGFSSGLGDLFWLGNALPGWGVLFLLAAGPTVVGFGLYNVSLSLLPSSVANLILTLEPAFTAVMAYFFLGERLSGVQLGGSLMILMGVALLDNPSLRDYNEPRSIVRPKSSIERGEARVTKVVIDDHESFDSLLRRFNKKVQRDRILSEARRRRFFEKPSVVRKRKKAAKLRKSRRQTYRDQQSRY